jgi:hypothetical protein
VSAVLLLLAGVAVVLAASVVGYVTASAKHFAAEAVRLREQNDMLLDRFQSVNATEFRSLHPVAMQGWPANTPTEYLHDPFGFHSEPVE